MYQSYSESSESHTSEKTGSLIPHGFDAGSSRFLNSLNVLRIPYLYVLLIFVAELISSYFLYWGIVVHAVVLVALLVHSTFVKDKPLSNFLSAIAVAPIIRIVSLAIPLSDFTEVERFAIVGIPIIICALTVIRTQNISSGELGLGRPKIRCAHLELAMMALAVPIGFIEYQILKPEAMADFELAKMIGPSLVFIFMTGFLEEWIFRGLMQNNAERLAGFHGVVCVSVLFGVLHTTNVAYWDIFLAGGAGFLFALVVRRTGTIWGVSMAHGIVNIVLFLIAPHLFAG